jgi:hypothetical protein
MAYGTVATDIIASSDTTTTGSGNAVTPPAFQNAAGVTAGTLCRAWVNFNGVTTVTVRASFNVASVTRSAAGTYLITFTNAMPDANYSVCFGNVSSSATNLTITTVLQGVYTTGATAKTAASVGIYTGSSAAASIVDVADVSVNIFR